MRFDDPFNTGCAESADQLFLQVRLARVETEAYAMPNKVAKGGRAYTAMSLRANRTAPMPNARAATAMTPTTDVNCSPFSRGVP